MGLYTQWITHKGKSILFVNAARLSESEFIAAMDEFKAECLRSPRDSRVLIDLTDTIMTNATNAKSREVDRDVNAYLREQGISRQPVATVGLTSLRRAIAQLISREIHFAESIEDAKDWLVEQEAK